MVRCIIRRIVGLKAVRVACNFATCRGEQTDVPREPGTRTIMFD